MLLDELVKTAEAVTATRSRLAKIEALAELLRRLEPAEIQTAVGLLTAKPRQGRVGVGWRGLAAVKGEPATNRASAWQTSTGRWTGCWPRPALDPPRSAQPSSMP